MSAFGKVRVDGILRTVRERLVNGTPARGVAYVLAGGECVGHTGGEWRRTGFAGLLGPGVAVDVQEGRRARALEQRAAILRRWHGSWSAPLNADTMKRLRAQGWAFTSELLIVAAFAPEEGTP